MHTAEGREHGSGAGAPSGSSGLKRAGSGDLAFQFLFSGALPAGESPAGALPLWHASPKREPSAGAVDQRRLSERSRTLSRSEVQGSGDSSANTAPAEGPAEVRRRRTPPITAVVDVHHFAPLNLKSRAARAPHRTPCAPELYFNTIRHCFSLESGLAAAWTRNLCIMPILSPCHRRACFDQSSATLTSTALLDKILLRVPGGAAK